MKWVDSRSSLNINAAKENREAGNSVVQHCRKLLNESLNKIFSQVLFGLDDNLIPTSRH